MIADSKPHGTIRLRSNEQKIPIGGSRELPKSSLAKLKASDTNKHTATIDLGSLQKIELGDQFQILTGYIGYVWRLDITKVDKISSEGVLSPVARTERLVDTSILVPGALAELIPTSDSRHAWLNPKK